MAGSINGLGGSAKVSDMVVKLPCVERDRPGKTENVHAGIMVGLCIARCTIIFGSMKDTSKVS